MFDEHRLIGLDFETYGSRPLPECGLENYVRDPHFTPLLARVVKKDLGSIHELRADFVHDSKDRVTDEIFEAIGDNFIVAHNAPFEKRVLRWLGIEYPADRFIDSAVIARAAGAGGKLEAAGPQLLGINKMAEGWDLIKLFAMPGKYQEKAGSMAFNPEVVVDHMEEWTTFGQYCGVDSRLGLDLALDWGWVLTERELGFAALTTEMNEAGWHVDTKLVMEMQRRYEENKEAALRQFRDDCDAGDLNLNSLKQMKEWCADRGVRASSFDEKHVARLLTTMDKKLTTMSVDDPKHEGYAQVRSLLATKQTLGGSSLSKLQTILDNVTEDDRLHDQYLHVGAGQTWRTTGRSVQMQNLKRLGEPANMETLEDLDTVWSNTELAENLRQVFTAEDLNGFQIVGDFSSVENRGLAYMAGEAWKMKAFRKGQDLYKVLASQIYHTPYDVVSKTQRQTGKVGELSCGYQAGPDAVLDFAKNMGVEMTAGEAAKLVTDWREANPAIVDFWWQLDEMLHTVIEGSGHLTTSHKLPYDGLRLDFTSQPAPESLTRQVGHDMKSLMIELWQGDEVILRRFFHGCYTRGRNICYFKPSERKGGDLWKATYVHPKTKQVTYYSIYGGKLAGILTQSFCREIFFRVLCEVRSWADHYRNLKVIGQFHDELVLDWKPTANGILNLEQSEARLTQLMSDAETIGFPNFPLAAEIKHDYRYTK